VRAYIIKRFLLFPPTLAIVTLLVFLIMWIVPGDAAIAILGSEGGINVEDLEKLRKELGLDRPVYVQYGDWMWDLVRGDFGKSVYYKIPVMDELQDRFLVTMELAIIAIAISVALAIPIGVLSAVKQDTALDYVVRLFTITGIALPSFWVGILIVAALSYGFDWLPPLGYATLWENPLKNLQQLVFPAAALAFQEMAFTARITRSTMLEVLRDDYMRTARAKGLSEMAVVGRHALKNALLPPLTISGWQFGRLLGGVVVIETIFVIPGVGSSLISAIAHRDYTMIQAIMVMVAGLILSLNLIIDLLYGWLDPRIRYG
jgi:peptide/nickel transport system permease protein